MLTREFLEALTPNWATLELLLIVALIVGYWLGSIGILAWALHMERKTKDQLALRDQLRRETRL